MVVDVPGPAGRARHPVTRRVDVPVRRHRLQVPAEVVRHVRPLGPGQVLPSDPRLQLRLGRHLGLGERTHVVARRRVLDAARAEPLHLIAVLGDASLGAHHEPQLVLSGGVVDVPRGLGLFRRTHARLRQRVRRLREELVPRVVGPDDRVSCAVDLPRHVAALVVLHEDGVPEPVRHARDVADRVVRVAELGETVRIGRRHAGADARELAVGAVLVDRRDAQRIGDGRDPRLDVVREAGDLPHSVRDRLDPVHVVGGPDVGEREARPVGLGDRRDAVAVSFVRVTGGVARERLAAGRELPRRIEVDRHRLHAAVVVVRVRDLPQRLPGREPRGDLEEVAPADPTVGVLDGLAVTHGDPGQEPTAVVRIADRVAARVRRGRDPGPAGALVGLLRAGRPVDPGVRRVGVDPDRVERRAVAHDGDVQPLRLVPEVVGLRTVRVVAPERVGPEVADVLPGSGLPAVAVVGVVAPAAVAVVRAKRGRVGPDARERSVEVLQHEVAGGEVHEGALAVAPLRRRAEHSALPQRGDRTQAQPHPAATDDRDHGLLPTVLWFRRAQPVPRDLRASPVRVRGVIRGVCRRFSSE